MSEIDFGLNDQKLYDKSGVKSNHIEDCAHGMSLSKSVDIDSREINGICNQVSNGQELKREEKDGKTLVDELNLIQSSGETMNASPDDISLKNFDVISKSEYLLHEKDGGKIGNWTDMEDIEISDGDKHEPEVSLEHEKKTGFELAWLGLTYDVKPNFFEDPSWGYINKLFHKHPRTILKNVSGCVRSGQFVALMGPSGAGKTCLLECLAGIRRSGVQGRINIRGRKNAQLVIVPQYDNFLPEFSVEEIISYGSKMKNPPNANHTEIVNKVIEQLGLEGCRSNKIRNCSGGQQKRVAIAQELVSKPNILILDEPSSGLDSSCCYLTMNVLRDVLKESIKSDEPMVIITTIHQPSAKVFRMFDKVYMLGKEGRFAYSGAPELLVDNIYTATGLECPRYANPADFMIELVSYDYGKDPVDKLTKIEITKGEQFLSNYGARGRRGQRDEIRTQRKKMGPTFDHDSSNCDNTIEKDDIDNCIGIEKQNISQITVNSDMSIDSQNEATATTYKSMQSNESSNDFTHTSQNRNFVSVTSKSDPKEKQIQLGRCSPDADTLKRNSKQNSSHIIYNYDRAHEFLQVVSNQGRSHPFFWHLYQHSSRSIKQSMRDPILNKMRIVFHVGFAFLVVVLFGQDSAGSRGCPPVLGLAPEITDQDNDNLVDLSDNVGFIFMCMMMITYVSLMTMTLTFPLEIKTVCVEFRNGWYSISSFFLGKTIGDLPFITMYPIIYCLLSYFMTNQATDIYWRPLYFTILIVLNALNSQTLGLIMGAIFVNSVTVATFIGPVSTIPWYLFTGFPKRIPRLPPPLRKISKYMFTRHIFDGLLVTMFGYDRCNCTAWVEEYYRLRDQELLRLGQIVDVELISSLDYYDDLSQIDNSSNSNALIFGDDNPMDPPLPESWDRTEKPDLFKLLETNEKAKAIFQFGLDFEPTCQANYSSYVMQEFHLTDTTLRDAIMIAISTLCLLRVLTFIIVRWKIRNRELG